MKSIIKKLILVESLRNRNRGFTLVETLVVIFIFGIIMAGTTLMLQKIFQSSRQEGMATTNVDQAEVVANTFMNELRNGAYGINGAYPIGEASNTEIIFYSTSPRGNGTVSRVRYFLSGSNVYKGITDPSGSPLAYNNANEVITTQVANMSLGNNPLFYYYNGNYNGTGVPIAQPVNINQIQFVKINLVVLKQEVANSTSTFTVNGGAVVRNLKTNLGN